MPYSLFYSIVLIYTNSCFLTYSERELVLEIDRLKHKNGMVKRKGKTPDQVAAFIKGLEQDRDYWKKEVETLQV